MTEQTDPQAARREDIAFHLRMLAQGRLAFAEPLAALLVPDEIPVIDIDLTDEPKPKKAKKAT